MEATRERRRKRPSWRCGGEEDENAKRRREAREEDPRRRPWEHGPRRDQCGGKVREGEEGKTETETEREREREGGKERENQRWERPAEPTPTRTNCFTGKSFAVLISRHDSFRNRVARWERNGEILESSPKSSSHVSRSTGRPDVARISLSLLPPLPSSEYHKGTGSNQMWRTIRLDTVDLNVPRQILDILKSRVHRCKARDTLCNHDDARTMTTRQTRVDASRCMSCWMREKRFRLLWLLRYIANLSDSQQTYAIGYKLYRIYF